MRAIIDSENAPGWMLLFGFLGLAVVVGVCSLWTDSTVASAIRNGASPEQAYCAIRAAGNDLRCAVIAARGAN